MLCYFQPLHNFRGLLSRIINGSEIFKSHAVGMDSWVPTTEISILWQTLFLDQL